MEKSILPRGASNVLIDMPKSGLAWRGQFFTDSPSPGGRAKVMSVVGSRMNLVLDLTYLSRLGMMVKISWGSFLAINLLPNWHFPGDTLGESDSTR